LDHNFENNFNQENQIGNVQIEDCRRLKELGNKLNELEKTLNNLMQQLEKKK